MNVAVRWFDIPATDIKRAVDFYSQLFEIKMEIMDCGTELMACFPDGNGAISQSPGLQPSANGCVLNFSVDGRIEELIERAVKMGSKVIVPLTLLEAQCGGCFANLLDSEGNRIGLYSTTPTK